MTVCEDELICDLAETYHILAYKEQDPRLIATLCVGLRSDSRVKMFLGEQRITLEQSLLARISDELAFISWSKTKDGQKNRNRPKSLLETLMEGPKEPENESFKTPEEFRAEWNRIVRSSNAGQ